MRQWTNDLNAMNYRGRSDWTPSQVQAVGWMSMSKMLGRAGQTAEEAIRQNIRNLSYELDFGEGAPWHQTFPEWAGLSPQEKAQVSKPVLDKIMDYVKARTGATEFLRLAATGGWGSDTNPAFRSALIASPEVAADAANMLGYLAQQTAVYESRTMPNGKNLGVAIYGKGLDNPDTVRALWSEVVRKHPDLAEGFSPGVNGQGLPGMELGFSGAGKKLENRLKSELIPTLQEAADKFGIDTESGLFRANTLMHGNDWKGDHGGTSYISRLAPRYSPNIQRELADYSRTELEPTIRQEISRAKAGRGGQGKAKGGRVAQKVTYARGGRAIPSYLKFGRPIMAHGGIVPHYDFGGSVPYGLTGITSSMQPGYQGTGLGAPSPYPMPMDTNWNSNSNLNSNSNYQPISTQTANPLEAGAIQRYASLPVEKLQELALQFHGTPQGAIIANLLKSKQAQPQQFGVAPQQQMAEGGGSYARGGFAEGGQPEDFGEAASMARHLDRGTTGFLHSAVPGRTDLIHAAPPIGAFVIPADIVSGIAQGNSNAGAFMLQNVFGKPMRAVSRFGGMPAPPPRFTEPIQGPAAKRGGRTGKGHPHEGEPTPILAAGGEFIVSPEGVRKVGGGDLTQGHDALDAWVVSKRKEIAKEMLKLPGPKR
jgi:hypothetical protein